ncbi:MAG: Flp pilus assembly complex ATPase component TadA [Gammaproteobacteria bacterium]|nr:Flp pilus assembly complex ATPase component TadA [Gammaproteobacteria bacterium]
MEQEQAQLQEYAELSNRRVLCSQADLNPKDRAMPTMLTWCRRHNEVVVLKSGIILSNQPTSRLVQNCKIAMRNKGLEPGAVYPATQELISMLLANAVDDTSVITDGNKDVSAQQQRLRLLVKEALDLDVTDIHIEVREDMAKIRFRKHGELFLHAEWLPHLAREIASVAFNKETDHAITHFNPLTPQNASMPLSIGKREVRLRLASLPAHRGFDMVMRILMTADERIVSLEKLGYLPDQIALITKALAMPYGAVILAGPTGSGKTTTLASCMSQIAYNRKVYTIEDPVEKYINSATQVPVNTEHYDRDFASMTRTVLRMDPDVIVLGEMRDADTATEMVRAAITGHLVFSTVHTNTAVDIVTRLNDLGVSHSLLASPNLLACLICQRLAPLLCDACAVPVMQSPPHRHLLPQWQAAFGDQLVNVRVRGENCAKCQGLGIAGRTVIAEIIWVDEQSREFIQRSDLLGWRKYLKQNGWISYQERVFNMVKRGLCDPYDAEKLMGEVAYNEHRPFSYR